MPLRPHMRAPDFRLDADASATAAAALLFDLGAGGGPERIHRELSERERGLSSTLRELLGYAHAVAVMVGSHGARLRGRLVEIVGDSQAARAIFKKGGSQRVDDESGELELFEAFLSVFEAAEAGGFDVVFRWVPREQLVEADALSKHLERHDFSLTPEALGQVQRWLEADLHLGLWDVDRVAAAHYAKAPRFNSLFGTAGAEAVDAFSQSWAQGVSFVLHDFNQLGKVLDRIERDDAEAVVVVPVWPSRPFWGRLRSGSWPQRVAHTLLLEPGSIVANAENAASCFFQGTFNSRLLVLRTCRLHGGSGAAGSGAGSAEGHAVGAPPVAAGEPADGAAGGAAGEPAAKRKRTGLSVAERRRARQAAGRGGAGAPLTPWTDSGPREVREEGFVEPALPSV